MKTLKIEKLECPKCETGSTSFYKHGTLTTSGRVTITCDSPACELDDLFETADEEDLETDGTAPEWNFDDALYCAKCDSKVVSEDEVACPKCFRISPDHVNYCSSCGNQLPHATEDDSQDEREPLDADKILEEL